MCVREYICVWVFVRGKERGCEIVRALASILLGNFLSFHFKCFCIHAYAYLISWIWYGKGFKNWSTQSQSNLPTTFCMSLTIYIKYYNSINNTSTALLKCNVNKNKSIQSHTNHERGSTKRTKLNIKIKKGPKNISAHSQAQRG